MSLLKPTHHDASDASYAADHRHKRLRVSTGHDEAAGCAARPVITPCVLHRAVLADVAVQQAGARP